MRKTCHRNFFATCVLGLSCAFRHMRMYDFTLELAKSSATTLTLYALSVRKYCAKTCMLILSNSMHTTNAIKQWKGCFSTRASIILSSTSQYSLVKVSAVLGPFNVGLEADLAWAPCGRCEESLHTFRHTHFTFGTQRNPSHTHSPGKLTWNRPKAGTLNFFSRSFYHAPDCLLPAAPRRNHPERRMHTDYQWINYSPHAHKMICFLAPLCCGQGNPMYIVCPHLHPDWRALCSIYEVCCSALSRSSKRSSIRPVGCYECVDRYGRDRQENK